MFSSKTTTLISKLDRHTLGSTVVAINHTLDTRYSLEGLHTHHGQSFPCIRSATLAPVRTHPLYLAAHVVGIDEAQFFPDLVATVQAMVETDGKLVYVAGLNGSFRRELFGHVHELLPWADSLLLLNAVCTECHDGKTPGLFSKLVAAEERPGDVLNGNQPPAAEERPGDVLVGGTTQYHAVCRKHFQAE